MYQKTVTENETNVHSRHGKWCCFHSGLSWTAIFAGAFVAIGLSFLLQLFGMGLGFSAYSMADTAGEAKAFAYGGYIAVVVAGMIAMFVAGWVSGFIGRPTCTSGCHGLVYGFVTWCLALIISMVIVANAAEFVGFQYNYLSSTKGVDVYTTSSSKAPALSSSTSGGREGTSSRANVAVNTEKGAADAAKGFFLLFLLFFAGALSAAFGGYTAVKRIKHDRYVNEA